MRSAISLLILISLAAPSSAQFDLDMSEQQLNAAIGTLTLADLAVNERGYISTWGLCAEDGKLFINDRTRLSEPDDYGAQFLARRLPERRLELTINTDAEDRNPKEARESLITSIAHITTCESHRLARPGSRYFQIESIDGHQSLSTLVGSPN